MATTKASRRNANQKTVFCTASENVVKTAKAVMVMFIASLLIVACAKENINPKPAAVGPAVTDSIKEMTDHWDKSVKSLIVNATPHDTLCYSWVEFAMNSQMKYSTQDGVMYSMNFAPEASLNVRLTPARQEVGSELELPTYRTKRETVYDTPINEGLYLGRKFKLRDTQADGSIAEIEATWRCLGIITAEGDTVLPPHIEFDKNIVLDSIHVEKFGEQTELDKPHKVVHCYTASYTSKGITGGEKTMKVQMRPWRIKSVTDVEQVLTGEPTYEEKWVGCPISEYQLTQKAPTNKGVVTTTKKFPVSLNFNVPELREQPSLDSLFVEKSAKSGFKCEVLGDSTTTADGFVGLTYTGLYSSKNTGKESGTSIESTTTFTYTVPVKFSNQWGSYDIKAPELSFEEGGFAMKSESEDADFHTWLTTNTILPKFGTCELDAIDELVRIKVGKDKPAVPVDSVYTKGGKGDDYDVLKTVYYSDGSKREYPFSYTGHHSASATNFGDKVTSSLNWSASELKDNGTSQVKDNGKVFTSTTRFEVTYVTTNKKSDASNGVESGSFGFSETHPVVVFVDGQTKLTFDERKVVLSGKGAQPAANYTLTVKDGISYKGYTYNMSCGVVFDGAEEADVTSQGLLLMIADEVGETKYDYEYSWSGNTITVKTTKTIPHTFAEDEVEVYQTSYTVSMTDLADGRVDAANTSFTVTATPSEKSLEPIKDGFYTISPRERAYTYVVSNGSVSREMNNTVTDAVIAFNDGKGSHTWNAQLNVTKNDSFGTAYADGDFTVTPLTTTVTAMATGTGAPTLTTKGVTSIYVENPKEISYRFTYEIDPDVSGGSIYADLLAERLVNGKVEKKWSCYGLVGQFGQYKPDVEMIYITDTNFSDNFSTTNHDTDAGQSGLGDEKAFSYVNTSKIENHFSVLFTANADADGNTTREVAGHVNYWSYKYQFTDPDNGHPEYLDFVVTGKTTTHKVDGGVYTRTIEVQINGQTVETQTGKVNVTVE
jgi:hypothetical protein